MEKNEIEAALEKSWKSLTGNMSSDASKIQKKDSGSVNEVSENFFDDTLQDML